MYWKVHCSKLLASSPWHSYSHKHGRFLTITFAPRRTCTTSFLSWRRRSTAVLTNESVISSLTVENVHLAHGQRQYPSASRVSSTNIQGRTRKSILIMLLARFIFFRAEEGKQKSEFMFTALQCNQDNNNKSCAFSSYAYSFHMPRYLALVYLHLGQTRRSKLDEKVRSASNCRWIDTKGNRKPAKTKQPQEIIWNHWPPSSAALWGYNCALFTRALK